MKPPHVWAAHGGASAAAAVATDTWERGVTKDGDMYKVQRWDVHSIKNVNHGRYATIEEANKVAQQVNQRLGEQVIINDQTRVAFREFFHEEWAWVEERPAARVGSPTVHSRMEDLGNDWVSMLFLFDVDILGPVYDPGLKKRKQALWSSEGRHRKSLEDAWDA